MWSRTFCCCAVPLYNSGIYAILVQFLVVSLVSGILSFAAPNIVAVSIPAFGSYLFGAVCIGVAVIQAMGFLGVYREKPALFKTYARLNGVLVSAALIIALAFIILSAVNHNAAVTSCEALFSSQVSASSASNLPAAGAVTSGSGICNIWTWIQLGIMGLLFVILLLCQFYFLMYQSIYLSEQKADHARYDSVYSSAREEIRQSGIYDAARVSGDGYGNHSFTHARTQSKSSGLRNEFAGEDYRNDGNYRDTEAGEFDAGYRREEAYHQGHDNGVYRDPYASEPQYHQERPHFEPPHRGESYRSDGYEKGGYR